MLILKKLVLANFRSFKKKAVAFSEGINLIVGPNTIGKTNILEAVHLLAKGKSFRAQKDEEMIRSNEKIAHIKGEGKDFKLEIILIKSDLEKQKKAKKIFKVDDVNKRWRDFLGKLKVVLFRPEDIDLILGEPLLRRNYLNSVLEPLDWQYRLCLLTYKKALRQRNKVLDKIRNKEADINQLLFWNQILLKNGNLISDKRKELVDFFNSYFSLRAEGFLLQVFYDKSEISQKRLEKYQTAEIALGKTLVGPHRDNLKFQILNLKSQIQKTRQEARLKDLALFGSRGEQRMAVLKLKRAELEYVLQKSGQKPILLLDDIFSELDKENRKAVLSLIGNYQTIITDTEVNQEIKTKANFIVLS